MSLRTIALLALPALFANAQQMNNGDAVNEALRDFQTGLAGVQEAAKNPELLAQLFRDMQVSSRAQVEVVVLSSGYPRTSHVAVGRTVHCRRR